MEIRSRVEMRQEMSTIELLLARVKDASFNYMRSCEMTQEQRVDGGEERRERFGKALGAAIAKFYSLHYT